MPMNQNLDVSKTSSDDIIQKINALNDEAWQVHDTEPKTGLKLSSEAKELSEKHNYRRGLAYAIRNMGVSYRYLSNLEEALSLSALAMEQFIELNDQSGESQALVSIGAIHYYMGDYEKALDYFLRGLKLGEEIDQKECMAYAYNGAGYIYSIQGDNEKGLNFLEKALELAKIIEKSGLQASILESIATLYLNDGKIDKAHEAFIECQKLSEKINDQINLGLSFFGIGEIFLQKSFLNEAKEYFLKSLKTHREFGYKVGQAESLLSLGKVSLLQGADETKDYLIKALVVAKEIKAKASIYMIHETLAEYYESKEDIHSFVKHYKLYHKYKSEVYKEEQELKQKYQNIQFEMDQLQKEAEINRLTNVVMKEKNEELKKKTEELEKSYESVSVLSKIGRDITSTLDLDTILNTVYENVNQLMDATVFGIGIYNEEEGSIEYQLSVEEGKRYQPYKRTMSDKTQLAVWCIENNKEVFINDIEKEFSSYLEDIDLTVLTTASLEDGSKPKTPNSLIYLPLQVKEKIIGLISIQSFEKNRYQKHHLEILKTLASYTSAALYNARSYETLQGTLNELKSTQDQLIQAEKLASLGQLTAGIAHEIKNPLNFVNNFSDLSIELIEEAREEVRRVTDDRRPGSEKSKVKRQKSPFEGGAEVPDRTEVGDDAISANDETPNLIFDILNDIEANLKTIHKHGSRADSIVKSMLQHSSGGTGKIEPNDLNHLVREFVNLSFHGMRAGEEPINVDLDYDLDTSIGNVPLIAEDFSRVIVNLVNNAFDAMREKEKLSEKAPRDRDYENHVAKVKSEKSLRQPTEGGDPSADGEQGDDAELNYSPKLSIRTKSSSNTVTIEIEDNGPGIPDEMKDKILQPFFTTKKGTQGTGLGLSITNDIIKAHGGNMDIDSRPGQTVFKIKLNG